MQREIAGLAALSLRNVAGDNVGTAVWDTNLIIRGSDPQWVGYDFDWTKDTGGTWKATPCPLGEGMVDWSRFFAALAHG